jgi:tetratricopeptide (TPR) repeat protein
MLAELRGEGDLDAAIADYLRSIELGCSQPGIARALVALLFQRQQFDQIDRVAQILQDRGQELHDLTLVSAINALRREEFERAVALARQAVPQASTLAKDHLALGQILVLAGRREAGGKELRRAVELDPGLPVARLALVQYLVQDKLMDEAKAALDEARKALPADRSALTLAQGFALVGETRQAEGLVREALAARPNDPAALRAAVDFYVSQGRSELAHALLKQLAAPKTRASAADLAWANRTRIKLLLSTGRRADQDQALDLADRNLKMNPESVEDRRLKAEILARRPNERGKAIKILETVAGEGLLGVNERFLLARLYLGQREETKYRAEMLKLLGRSVRIPEHLVHFVAFLIDGNQLDEADRWLAELRKVEPQGLPAVDLGSRLLDLRKRRPELLSLLEARGREVPDQIGTIADLLNRYGFAKQAEAAYKAFVARDPKQPERVLALAGFLARQDRVPEAMEMLKKAWATCRPEQVATAALPVFDAPSASEDQKRQVEAWLVEAVRQRPESVLLTAKLGSIWVNQGRFDETEALCRRVLVSAPDNAGALNTLAWLLSMRDHGNADEAIKLMDRAIQILGASPPLADTRAVAYIKSGRLDQAVEELLAVRRLAPQKSSFALHLAWAYQAKGQGDQARLQLREAESLGLKSGSLNPLELTVFQRLQKELTPR